MTSLTLALDAMGGDFGPQVTVPAALQALAADLKLRLLLVGSPETINPLLAAADPALLERLRVIPTAHVVVSDTKPSTAIRTSSGSSMRVALELIKNGEAQACISAGNTGTLMGLAKMIIKPLEGIIRPALIAIIPNRQHGKTVFLDLGANVECDSTVLTQFAIMGSVMAEEVAGIINPRVALLNIGEEEAKGLASIRAAAAILKSLTTINYIGYLEAHDLLAGKADVIVCDGFIGNITLKTMEGVIRVFISLLKSVPEKGKQSLCITLLERWLQQRIIKRFGYLSPDQYNGACLLGLQGVVVKSHGSANQNAFSVAIEQAAQAVRRQLPEGIAARLTTCSYPRATDRPCIQKF